MIQRIQSIYLMIAGVLTGILFFVPFAKLAGKSGTIYRFDLKGIYPEEVLKPEILLSSLPIVIVLVINLVLITWCIFAYKNRLFQIKLASFTMIGQLLFLGLAGYYTLVSAKKLAALYSFSYYSLFPLIALILIFLSIRAIKKDEQLVRSIDRIR